MKTSSPPVGIFGLQDGRLSVVKLFAPLIGVNFGAGVSGMGV
ncbi:MAG: hypothetical protein ACLQUY_15410 [Ktedonobacterales bacterium]